MTFLEKYRKTNNKWHDKVFIIELYHLAMTNYNKKWSIKNTSQYFNISIGLASENLKIANAIHHNQELIYCKTRHDVLDKINNNEG